MSAVEEITAGLETVRFEAASDHGWTAAYGYRVGPFAVHDAGPFSGCDILSYRVSHIETGMYIGRILDAHGLTLGEAVDFARFMEACGVPWDAVRRADSGKPGDVVVPEGFVAMGRDAVLRWGRQRGKL